MVRILLVLSAMSAVLRLACCTVPMTDGRIVGGLPVDISQYSYQVSIRLNGKHFCGGSIIHPKFILTAAHCIHEDRINLITINAGSTYRNYTGQEIALIDVFIHEKYNAINHDYDVAMLLLERDLILNENVEPIRLSFNDPSSGDKVTVTGWGFTSQGGVGSNILQKVDLYVMGRETCQYRYLPRPITERMFCARDSNKDSCQGDSGGPLIDKSNELVGIVSWGIGCANPLYPGVYTLVPSVRDWIESTISNVE